MIVYNLKDSFEVRFEEDEWEAIDKASDTLRRFSEVLYENGFYFEEMADLVGGALKRLDELSWKGAHEFVFEKENKDGSKREEKS